MKIMRRLGADCNNWPSAQVREQCLPLDFCERLKLTVVTLPGLRYNEGANCLCGTQERRRSTRSSLRLRIADHPAAATCSGCSVLLSDSLGPTIKNVLIDEVIPAKNANVRLRSHDSGRLGGPGDWGPWNRPGAVQIMYQRPAVLHVPGDNKSAGERLWLPTPILIASRGDD
jgi:hypothetical protein